MNDLMFVAGTRPEIIKISPVLLEVIKRGLRYRLIYSNQHYDYNMSKIFFDSLENFISSSEYPFSVMFPAIGITFLAI